MPSEDRDAQCSATAESTVSETFSQLVSCSSLSWVQRDASACRDAAVSEALYDTSKHVKLGHCRASACKEASVTPSPGSSSASARLNAFRRPPAVAASSATAASDAVSKTQRSNTSSLLHVTTSSKPRDVTQVPVSAIPRSKGHLVANACADLSPMGAKLRSRNCSLDPQQRSARATPSSLRRMHFRSSATSTCPFARVTARQPSSVSPASFLSWKSRRC
mmetsp:Transcript_70875/g.207671  ORF Transcript_70875/g.207671 Transcript_70875/m.207671 type:complete len:220 (+) Transcript_70875:350-1009(+)